MAPPPPPSPASPPPCRRTPCRRPPTPAARRRARRGLCPPADLRRRHRRLDVAEPVAGDLELGRRDVALSVEARLEQPQPQAEHRMPPRRLREGTTIPPERRELISGGVEA